MKRPCTSPLPFATLLVVTLLLSAASAHAQTFTLVQADLPQDSRYTSVAPADYDGDGDLDLLVRGYLGAFRDGSVRLYRSDGFTDSTWTLTDIPIDAGDLAQSNASLENTSDIAWADYDNDGDLDAILTGYRGSELLRNDADGLAATDLVTFRYSESVRYNGLDLNAVAWGDYDNDGDLDFAVPNVMANGETGPRATQLYRNEGGSFRKVSAGLPDIYSGEVRWGDYDNDGDLDLLLTDYKRDLTSSANFDGFVRLFRNDGGKLVDSGINLTPFRLKAVAWEDSDGDGDLDLVLAGGELLAPQAAVYENVDGSYGNAQAIGVGELFNTVTALEWGDLDGDGDADLLIVGDDERYIQPVPGCRELSILGGKAQLFVNEAGTYTASSVAMETPDPAFRGGTQALADYDNDGDLDFLIYGDYAEQIITVIDPETCSFSRETVNSYEIRLYRNDLSQANAPPDRPAALAVALDGSDATLSWEPASDDHTPGAALTYNLHVTTLLGSDMVSPMSRANGARLLPQPGNVSLNTAWTLRGLPPGTYEWRVQAIDNALNGGPFAEGGSFRVGAVDAEDDATLPQAFKATGVFPNPVRRTGTLRLDLPETAEVAVALYDLLGREVLRTAPAPLVAGRERTVTFDVGALPSGVYVWRASVALSERTEQASGRLAIVR